MAIKKTVDNKQEKYQVFLVDDHPIVRHGLVQLMHQETGLEVCGEADNASDALEMVAKRKPDVVIVDLTLKNSNGLELIKDLKARWPKLTILVVSMHDESIFAERVIRAGAMGYVMKQELTENFAIAIHRVLNGEIYVSDRIATRMLQKFHGTRSRIDASPLESLSDRELEVFQLIGKGLDRQEIANQLRLSIKTVDTYREHLKEKLKLSNASELVQHAVQWVQSLV